MVRNAFGTRVFGHGEKKNTFGTHVLEYVVRNIFEHVFWNTGKEILYKHVFFNTGIGILLEHVFWKTGKVIILEHVVRSLLGHVVWNTRGKEYFWNTCFETRG